VSAALLEGEEKRTPSVSSEQAAAPGTPSTFDTPSLPLTATPADSEATPQPRRWTRTRAPKPSCIAHNFQTGRMVHPGTSPPSPRAQPARLWGLRRRPRGGRGSDDGGRRYAGTHSQTSVAQRRHLRPETADADAPEPRTLAEAKRSPEPHRSRLTSTPYPPLSPQTKYPRTQRGPHHTRRAQSRKNSVKRAAPTRTQRRPMSQQTLARSLGGRQAGPPPPLLARAPRRAAHWRAIQTRPAAWPGTGAPYSGARSPSTAPPPLSPSQRPPTIGSGNVAASPGHAHWETVERILFPTSPTHPTRVLHTRRSAAHRRAIQTRQQHRRGPARHIGARVPHHRERPHRSDVRRQGGVTPLQPRLKHLFQASQQPIATTREWHDDDDHHHHHHRDRAHRSGTVADVLTSPCFRQGVALRRIPWTAREARGNVAKAAVGPRTLSECIN